MRVGILIIPRSLKAILCGDTSFTAFGEGIGKEVRDGRGVAERGTRGFESSRACGSLRRVSSEGPGCRSRSHGKHHRDLAPWKAGKACFPGACSSGDGGGRLRSSAAGAPSAFHELLLA